MEKPYKWSSECDPWARMRSKEVSTLFAPLLSVCSTLSLRQILASSGHTNTFHSSFCYRLYELPCMRQWVWQHHNREYRLGGFHSDPIHFRFCIWRWLASIVRVRWDRVPISRINAGRLQLHDLCLRLDGLWQDAHDDGRPDGPAWARHYSELLRAHIRSHRWKRSQWGDRWNQVFGSMLILGNIQGGRVWPPDREEARRCAIEARCERGPGQGILREGPQMDHG